MGGISRSVFEQFGPGIARFRGNVSLENFGGFASVRTPPREWDTAGATAFLLRVRGDGFDGIQYQQRFAAVAGEWTDVHLPVRALGLMISDQQAGPFELLVDRSAIER